MKRHICLLAAAASLVTCLVAANSARAIDEVALIIDKNVYDSCQEKLLRYKADVEAQFPVHLRICSEANFESYSPYQMRSYIQNQYNTNHISGVILAGQIQYDKWQQTTEPENRGINSSYYEDMDGTFSDWNDDGYDDYHTWGAKAGPEIWCSWMRPQANNNVGGLNSFLDKTHAYYTGQVEFNHSALIADVTDYDDNIRGSYFNQYEHLSELYGSENVDIMGEGDQLLWDINYYNALQQNRYEILDPMTHASASSEMCDLGGLWSYQVKNMTGGAIMSLIYGCHSADFMQEPNLNLCQSFVFGDSIGQASAGTSWSYGLGEKYAIYDVLQNGGYLGQGWLNMEKLVNTPTYIKGSVSNVDANRFMWGHSLIGNPFLYANYTAPPVPEPSSLAAILIPCATLMLRKRRK